MLPSTLPPPSEAETTEGGRFLAGLTKGNSAEQTHCQCETNSAPARVSFVGLVVCRQGTKKKKKKKKCFLAAG